MPTEQADRTETSLASVAGVEGTELTPEVLAQLPPGVPTAPWPLQASSIIWFARPSAAAKRALQPGMRGRPIAVAGMMVRYADTPVGAYSEVAGMCALRRGLGVVGHVPFIAVDSAPSVVGGRANWSLPKTLARFEGDPATDREMRGTHPLWEVSARAKALGPAMPLPASFRTFQIAPDGTETWSRARMRLRVRPAVVRVRTSGTPQLTDWLRSGRYPGVIAERFDGTLGPARAA